MSVSNPSQEGRVAIVADTTAAIPQNLIEELEIRLVPYYVNIGTQTLRDVIDISREQFYSWLPTAAALPTTSNPGAGDYLTLFQDLYQKTREVIAITMTSIGSGAYQAAMIAKEMAQTEMPDLKILVVDSRQVAMAHGWSVIQAARAALAGAGLMRVGNVARETAFDATMIQTADTLKYLYMGGRIGRAMHMVGALLRVKPLISMEDGEIVAVGKARSRIGAYEKMVDLIAKKVELGGKIRVAYMHAAAQEEVEVLREKVEQAFHCVESLVTELSPALGVHTGPGTTGLAYIPIQS